MMMGTKKGRRYLASLLILPAPLILSVLAPVFRLLFGVDTYALNGPSSVVSTDEPGNPRFFVADAGFEPTISGL
jgi:hypothetical protein